jgi:hypothetical protein
MVGITQTSDGRRRRVGDARGVEPFGALRWAVGRLSVAALAQPNEASSVEIYRQ